MSRHDVRSIPVDLPRYFRGTWQMVACAFPEGVAEEHFWPLMIHLGEGMSLRQLSAFMIHLFQRDVGYHHALVAKSRTRPEPSDLDDVGRRLFACGYAEWLETDEYGNET